MNNSMVAHLWANEKKESARGSNLFFEGRSISIIRKALTSLGIDILIRSKDSGDT